MAVRIRMKKMGRKHRPFFRICAIDARSPRDGRVIEELGTYDPMVPDTDARVTLKHERVTYWLGVGALPSTNVNALIKKYGPEGTHLQQMAQARERLAMPKAVPEAGEAVYKPQPKTAPAEAAPAEAEAPAQQAEEAVAEGAVAEGAAAEQPAAEQSAAEQPATAEPAAERSPEKSE